MTIGDGVLDLAGRRLGDHLQFGFPGALVAVPLPRLHHVVGDPEDEFTGETAR